MKKMFAVLLASLMLASLPLAMAGPGDGGGGGGGGMQQNPGQSFGYVVDQDLYDGFNNSRIITQWHHCHGWL